MFIFFSLSFCSFFALSVVSLRIVSFIRCRTVFLNNFIIWNDGIYNCHISVCTQRSVSVPLFLCLSVSVCLCRILPLLHSVANGISACHYYCYRRHSVHFGRLSIRSVRFNAIGLTTFFIFIDRMWYRPLIIASCFTRLRFFDLYIFLKAIWLCLTWTRDL